MTREDDNKKLIGQFNDGLAGYFETGDLDAFLGVVAPDARLTIPGMPADLAGLRAALPMFREGLSDFRMQISDLIAEGDLVAYRVTWTATHSGSFMGIPGTGHTITVTETHFDRIRDGQIVEHGGDWDRLGMLEQLGAVPAPA